MNIVLVNWSRIDQVVILDGRMPIFEHAKQTGYWIPDEMVDSFVELAMSNEHVTQVTIYKYDKTYK